MHKKALLLPLLVGALFSTILYVLYCAPRNKRPQPTADDPDPLPRNAQPDDRADLSTRIQHAVEAMEEVDEGTMHDDEAEEYGAINPS